MKIRRLLAFIAVSLVAFSACSDDSGESGGADSGEVWSDGGEVSSDGGSDADAGDTSADAGDSGPSLVDAERAFELVDPFIGTGGLGFGYAALTPAAQQPNGLVKLGPDTTDGGGHPDQSHFSGYHFDDPEVRGFSHLHLIGTGAAGLGNLRVLPVAQVDADQPWYQYTAMDKASETAEPGYYAVHLPDAGVTAELTASMRGGFHRYTSDNAGMTLIFDAAASVKSSPDTTVDLSVDGNTLEGSVVYSGDFATRSGPFTLYFSATIDPAPSAVSTWDDNGVHDAQTSTQGSRGGVVLSFDTAAEVDLRVGLSFVDLQQARLHRSQELDDHSFEQVRQQAKEAWLDKLGKVRLRGGTEQNQRIFYTALYNAWRMPTRLDGIDGRYRGMDEQVHQADGYRYYSDMSLWDSFRTLHPWLVLVDPPLQRDCLKSLLAMKDATGYIPRWPALQTYTGSMMGTPADQVFAGSALKGIDGVDYDAAFDALLSTATETPPPGAPFGGRDGVERYIELGWLPADEYDESVSDTLEYAWGDFALANLADYLGRDEADALRQRAGNWQNLFDEQTKFLTPRNADGSFGDINAGGTAGGGGYTEGNAWHWRFYPIWQPDEFTAAFGGPAGLFAPLSRFFADSGINSDDLRTLLPDSMYWHGNEHDLGAVYLFNFTNRPADVGKWVRAIQTTAYTTGVDGLPGNDDGGTLSAWYLFSALGFSPVAGSDLYMIGSPLFPYAEVDVGDGQTLVVEADGADAQTPYVDGLTVDGHTVDGPYLTHDQLMGATLHFEMSSANPDAN